MIDTAFEKHPYPPFLCDGAKVLFAGSFPPIKLTRNYRAGEVDRLTALYNEYLLRYPFSERDFDFYYGNAGNSFWKILERIFAVRLISRDDIVNILHENKIAVTDIAEVVVRKLSGIKNGRKKLPADITGQLSDYKVSSSDSCLEIIKYRSLIDDLYRYESIRAVLFTSSFAYRQFLSRNADGKIDGQQSGEMILTLGRRKIPLIVLPSPSGSANMSIGANKEFKQQKLLNSGYDTIQYRTEKYSAVLTEILR